MAERRLRAVVRETRFYEVEVDAGDMVDAMAKASRIAAAGEVAPFLIHFSGEYGHPRCKAVGEPWASSRGWYDMHEPDDLVVVETSYGHVFSKSDVEILRKRLTELGLKVVDSWNGTGCNTVSFRCTGRKGTDPMPKTDVTALLAPRGEEPVKEPTTDETFDERQRGRT